MNPSVSIIIPIFNRLTLLPFTINSIFEQTYEDWEIIAVDDGSTDGSYELIYEMSKKDSRIIPIKNKSGIKGPSAARNVGIKHSNANHIIFLDSDDQLEKFCLEQRLNIMLSEGNLSYAVFKQNTFVYDSSISAGLYNTFPTSQETYLDLFLRSDNPWQTMAVIWKKSALLKLKGFDESFIFMEDPDLHSRALLDNELQFRFCIELPPDCLYRIGNKDFPKDDSFYANSILFRFKYLKKILPLVRNSEISIIRKKNASKNWTIGMWNLFSKFLLSRINIFYLDTLQFLEWANFNQALSPINLIKARLLIEIWKKDLLLFRIFKLKGIVYFIFFKLKVGSFINYR